MIIFGWVLVTLGALGTISAVTLEIIKHEPIYMFLMKITCGIMGCGGIVLTIQALV